MKQSTELTNSSFQFEHHQSIADELRPVISGGIALRSDESYEAARRVWNRAVPHRPVLDIEEEGEILTEEELHAQCIMLLFGGHETTRNLIGNGMYTLLRHPKEAAELGRTRS